MFVENLESVLYYFCSPDDQVNFRQFVKILAIFRPVKRHSSHTQIISDRNTKENKLKCECIKERRFYGCSIGKIFSGVAG